MPQAASDTNAHEIDEVEDDMRLFAHSARPEWGLAALVSQNDQHAAFQFEDGKLRKFPHAFLQKLHVVERDRGETEAIMDRLGLQANVNVGRKVRKAAGEQVISLDKQVQLFRGDFADGFEDDAFVAKHRGREGGRALKAHRGPAAARAQERFGEGALAELVAAGRHDEVIERAISLLESTSLVTAKQLLPLRELDPQSRVWAANALHLIIDGEDPIGDVVDAWVGALAAGGKLSWPLVTALPALIDPQRHVCIADSVVRRQARWMAPNLTVATMPDGRTYARLMSMMERLRESLGEHDLAPRDFLDVYDFIWLTLRPAAIKRMAGPPPSGGADATGAG